MEKYDSGTQNVSLRVLSSTLTLASRGGLVNFDQVVDASQVLQSAISDLVSQRTLPASLTPRITGNKKHSDEGAMLLAIRVYATVRGRH